MTDYPINLNLRSKAVLVVGGGRVGLRKVDRLLACAADVTVVSPTVQASIRLWADQGRLNWQRRGYTDTDMDGMFMVIAASDSALLNRQVSRDAARRGLLCNVVDQPDQGNFTLPAVVDCGRLQLTVSTSGQSPAFAKHLKNELARRYGPEYDRFLALMGAVRIKMLAGPLPATAHKPLFTQLIQCGLLDLVRQGCREAIDRQLYNVLGPGYTCADLLPDVYGTDTHKTQERQ